MDIPTTSQEILIPIAQIRKLGLRQVKLLAQITQWVRGKVRYESWKAFTIVFTYYIW